MSKPKQSILVQRQIPEHIRESYPVFVEFVKLYYDFLQETQSQNLEQIRDIDTTLDEFVERFKSEVAKNFPVNLAGDQRLLLKHIREFYLSRGSEASYKFLFRTLFDKEATLFYPSTQILRASDGKWTQDVSVFVKVDAGTTTLFPLEQQFINISTSLKSIQTFVNKVNQYSDTIFEVFIQRDYVNQIEVGAAVTFTSGENTYSGTVLKCPSKISIFKPGKGFKIGDIYALKTSLGRGCVVKITKTDSNGGIRAVQVIRFGLDYETTFYSYLSSKNISAFEYVHPLKLNAVGPQPSYNERSGGFVDYGFASKQTYFAYDSTIPVAPENQADRFYADSSYVGDIQQQFYTDATESVVDEDIAIIQIDLGAVAKYPGYYSTVDGFVSDEIYIQDGNYYQSYSYVIRVEEELKKYSDVMKALVHPAGTKSFSEYRILNVLKLTATAPLLFRVLSLPTVGSTPSTISMSEIVSRLLGKSFIDTTSQSDASSTQLNKGLSDTVSTLANESILRAVTKAFEESTNQQTDAIRFSLTKSLSDAVIPQDLLSNRLSRSLTDTISSFAEEVMVAITVLRDATDSFTLSDTDTFAFSKFLEDTLSSIADLTSIALSRALADSISTSEALSSASSKTLGDAINSSMSGRLALSQYDGESFFDVFDDYQQYTQIS